MSEVDRTPVAGADVCVVGSGPAGALVAHGLAARDHDVVVLEAGPRFPPGERLRQMEAYLRPSQTPADVYDMTGQRDAYTTDATYRLNLSRVKGVGGTTLHWGGTTPRLHEEDFEMATRHGVGRDWPIDYDDLRPYYARAERVMGVAGADDSPFGPPREEPYPMEPFAPSYSDALFAEGCAAAGVTTHTAPRAQNTETYDGRSECVGYGTCNPVCPSGAKYSADVHVRKAEREGALVYDSVPVQRLETTRAGDRVTAAVYATPAGETHRQRADRFVVACGAVETARLLLLSTSSAHPDGLANGSDAVGRYFMSHPEMSTEATLDSPTGQNRIGFPTTISHQHYASTAQRGSVQVEFSNTATVPLATAAMADATVFEALQSALDAPGDLGRWADVAREPVAGATWGDELLADLRSTYGNHLQVNAIVEQLPRADNRVTLDHSTTDDQGKPVPHLSIETGPYAEAAREVARETEVEILEAMGADVGADPIGGFVPHQMGTTRMGDDPAATVVDRDLVAHEVPNLSLVTTGVYPTGGAVNPTLTVAALALRAVDHLDEAMAG